jgi:Cu(I)/Ag(I) efflux system membrane protein CusA/SilA
MKRIAAPMVGGLLTSAFLTLEIIPVVYTYWRQEQVLWERLEELDPLKRSSLETWATIQKIGWFALAGVVAARFYVDAPGWAFGLAALAAGGTALAGGAGYLRRRPAAKRLVWPPVRAVPLPLAKSA